MDTLIHIILGDSAANASGLIGSIDERMSLIRVQQTANGVRSTLFSYGNLGANCRVIYNEAVSSNEPPIIITQLDNC